MNEKIEKYLEEGEFLFEDNDEKYHSKVVQDISDLTDGEYIPEVWAKSGYEMCVQFDNITYTVNKTGLSFVDALADKEFVEAQQNLTAEDLDGGLHNIQVPNSFYEKSAKDAEEAAEFIIINDEAGEIPHKVDGVNVTFTPEELILLTEVLEKFAVRMQGLDYAYNEMKMEDLYHQQALVRQMRDNVDSTFDHYVRVRPFTPFLIPWLRRIGKEKTRQGKE